MKNIQIIIFIITIFFSTVTLIKAKVKNPNNYSTSKEELYFNKQLPIEIKPGTKLESIFYFNQQLKVVNPPIAPVKDKYKTHLKIPKANLD